MDSDNKGGNLIVLREMYQCNSCLKIFCEMEELNAHKCLRANIHVKKSLEYNAEKNCLDEKTNKKILSKRNIYICSTCNREFTQKKFFERHCKLHNRRINCSNLMSSKFGKIKGVHHKNSYFNESLEVIEDLADSCEENCDNEKKMHECGDKSFLSKKRDIKYENALLKAEYMKNHVSDQKNIKISHETIPPKSILKSHKPLHSNNLHTKRVCSSDSPKFTFEKEYALHKKCSENISETKEKLENCNENYLDRDEIFGDELISDDKSFKLNNIKKENTFLKAEFRKTCISSRKKMLTCDVCHETLLGKKALKVHKMFHNGELPIECELCLEKFMNKTDYSDHMKIHSSKKDFKCDRCDKSFRLKVYLIQHQKSHLNKKMYVCDICDKQFPVLQNLQRHYRCHTNEKPYSCKMCPRTFRSQDSLRYHYYVHNNERPYMCEKCGKTFNTPSALYIHKYTHQKIRRFACDKCDLQFSTKSKYTLHYRNHTNERPYKCNICPKSFKSKVALTAHLQTHAETLPFHCDICDRYYATKSSFTKHCRIHSDNTANVCQICGRCFSYQYALDIHMVTHTKEKPFKCDMCCKKFSQKGTLTRHVTKCSGKSVSRDLSVTDVFVTEWHS